jgi:hypothetical protein
MIGYPISQESLEERIEKESPGWLERTAERVARFKKARAYDETSSLWSAIKVVYMRLQGNSKCAFCERKLESEEYGKGEQAVEHFRPKKRIQAWRVSKQLRDLGVRCTDVPNDGRGYYALPYHPFNYSASCNPCNSVLKKDYFPIAATFDIDGDDPKRLLNEKPLLIYPIGDFDEDPEKLIRFHGLSPQSLSKRGHPRARALVTIEFFKLDDLKRKNLFRERAMVIIAMYPQLKVMYGNGSPAKKVKAKALVEGYTSPESPHANCARSFRALFPQQVDEAEAIFDKASAFLISIS